MSPGGSERRSPSAGGGDPDGSAGGAGVLPRGNEKWLDHLRELGEELRATFAEERRAIGALDHARLTYLAVHKQHLAEQIAEARQAGPAVDAPVVRDLFTALRAEAHANAVLATVATEAVRALLGCESTGGYDRSARRTTMPMRTILATY